MVNEGNREVVGSNPGYYMESNYYIEEVKRKIAKNGQTKKNHGSCSVVNVIK